MVANNYDAGLGEAAWRATSVLAHAFKSLQAGLERHTAHCLSELLKISTACGVEINEILEKKNVKKTQSRH